MKEAKSCTNIEEVRAGIDQIDRKIMELLAKRQGYVVEVVRFKTDQESIVAKDRQEQLYRKREEWADELNLSPRMIREMFEVMVQHNIKKEIEIYQSKNK